MIKNTIKKNGLDLPGTPHHPLRGGYGTNFDFRFFRSPFAATRSWFIQITQTKFYKVVQCNLEKISSTFFSKYLSYWGNPLTWKIFFSQKYFFQNVSPPASFKIFPKFQKEVLKNSEPHLSYLFWAQIFAPLYFLGTKISKHAAWFDILVPKKYKGAKFCAQNR